MTTPDEKNNDASLPVLAVPGPHAASFTDTPAGASIQTKAKAHNIAVSAAVTEAARKDGDDLIRSLRTCAAGVNVYLYGSSLICGLLFAEQRKESSA